MEAGLHLAAGRVRVGRAARGVWGEIYGEDSQIAGHVRANGGLLTADEEVARVVLDH